MNSTSRQHAKLSMLFSLIVLSIYSIELTRNADAFEIGIPDIPFLNFNFDNIIKPEIEEHISEEERDKVSDKISTGSKEGKQADFSLDLQSKNEVFETDAANSLQMYDSLPFPSNTINNAVYDQSQQEVEERDMGHKEEMNKQEFNHIATFSPDTLPLISDYTDVPSTSLFSPDIEAGKSIPNQYIVVLKDDKSQLSDFFSMISDDLQFHGVEFLQVYKTALTGFAIKVPNEKVIEAIAQLPMVDYVEADVMTKAFAQTLPTGINRIDGDLSSTQSGDGKGNIDIDIAILDTGIDLKHSDLNIYHQKSFVTGNNGFFYLFGSRTNNTANDDNGHGTHVAGTAAAKDNAIGSVGVAPGAKLWAIKILDNKGAGPLSTVIKGIDYVTQYANHIEVANLSLGCECKSTAFDTAISNSAEAGIVFVVAAGNGAKDASNILPANNPNVITVSAISDSDGKCGVKGPSTGYGDDEALTGFSNFGLVVDLAAPGAKIYSTYKDNSYATISGTSIASPHVAGAAALYLSKNPEASPSDVYNALVTQGSTTDIRCDGKGHGYFSGDNDTEREPLLYIKNH